MMKTNLRLLIIILSCGFLGQCGNKSASPEINNTIYKYSIPELTGDGWEVAHLAEVGINQTTIEVLMDNISVNTMPELHGIVIIRNGKLVFEEYFEDWNRDRLHMIMSCTKSITSALIGIAIKDGFISGINNRLFDYFPEYDSLLTSRKDSIELRHVLTMTAGLEWDQTSYSYTNANNSLIKLFRNDGPWIPYVLGLEAIYSPGTHFAYSDGLALLAGEILIRTTGQSIEQWADEKLFQPLGIEVKGWQHRIKGSTNSGYGLYLRPRDMAKFGQLYLNEGIWQDQQVIHADWVSKSTAEIYKLGPAWYYGYMWWRVCYYTETGKQYKAIAASGDHGQFIFLFPELNEVVVFTMGRPSGLGANQAHWALVNYILPASRHD